MAPTLLPHRHRLRVASLAGLLVAAIVAAVIVGHNRGGRTEPTTIPTLPAFTTNLAASAVAAAQPWTQYHADAAHTGAISGPPLTPSTAA